MMIQGVGGVINLNLYNCNARLMSRQSEADYLKSDDLGLVIAKGMAVMYKEDPKNPVDFLAKWLLNYS